MELEKLQKKLEKCRQIGCKFDQDIFFLKLEADYQKYISKFSPAYLSGSNWYVGPSLTNYIVSKRLDDGLLSLLFYISKKIES